MSSEFPLVESAEELFEQAPCGYLTTTLDGTIVRVNRTFEQWTGHQREDLVGKVRFADLLDAGGRIYHETHYAPLLMMQGTVREVALEIRRADGSLLSALVNSMLQHDEAGAPCAIRTTVFDATDRRRYERELVSAHRREQAVALRLQQSMLAGRLPVDERFELAVHYSPAEGALEVGGDWYDVFVTGADSVILVVGDVVGRGIEAAATMGQLRSAVRALAATGLAPAGLLHAMDAFSHRHSVGATTTLVYAQLDLHERQLCMACAGHPPVVVAEPGSAPRFLWEGRSWPLDVFAESAERAQAAYRLAPGTTLLMYTDGLVERRRETMYDGMGRLLDELGHRREEPMDVLVPGLAEALAAPHQTDDVCLLGLRLRPS